MSSVVSSQSVLVLGAQELEEEIHCGPLGKEVLPDVTTDFGVDRVAENEVLEALGGVRGEIRDLCCVQGFVEWSLPGAYGV